MFFNMYQALACNLDVSAESTGTDLANSNQCHAIPLQPKKCVVIHTITKARVLYLLGAGRSGLNAEAH